MIRIGETIGNYEVVRQIGQGAMGAVFEVRHTLIGRRSAIKVPAPELLQDPEFAIRFLNEARAANRVRHPGLLEIYEYGNLPAGAPYLVMELLEGESLERRLEQCGRRLSRRVALHFCRQIAGALAVAHANGIIHRDLKPGNVMLIPDPEVAGRERVKVLDFGIAKLAPTTLTGAPERPLTRTGLVMGTPEYMAPEQCMGAARVDGQADVYALGVMLFEMLSGQRPFKGAHPVETMSMQIGAVVPDLEPRVPGIDREVVILVNQMLAKHPPQRPTMPEVAAELRKLLGESVEIGGASPVAPSKPRPEPATVAVPASDECPFIVGPPIADPRRFFGRQRILRRLVGLWRRAPLQNAALLGARRSGKTSLLLHLKAHVASLPASSWSGAPPSFCYVHFQDPRLASREALLGQLLRGLELGTQPGEPCTMERFIERVADGLRGPTVILFDELDVALARYSELDDRFWEGLRALATNQVGGNLAFVLGCHGAPGDLARQSQHGSPFFNIFGYTTALGPFLEDEADALMASSPRPFSVEDRAFMVEQSGRWPILLQILCRERCQSLQEGDQSDAWREEALRQLEPFRHLLGKGP